MSLDDVVLKAIEQSMKNLQDKIHKIELNDSSNTARAVPTMIVADLPTAGEIGRLRYATNGRKVGEGAGLGTGVLVYDDGVAWRRTGDDTTVAV